MHRLRDSVADKLVRASRKLSREVDRLAFSPPVTHVYNPLQYAREAHEVYLRKFGNSRKRVLFLGMNPGPYGMVQTAVPFGEVAIVRDWMNITATVGKPKNEHPKRPVDGFDCKRSEVSGRRLWGLFSELYPDARDFFADHFVTNYCPLVFMEERGTNRTPDKLPASEMEPLTLACDTHLRKIVSILEPEYLIGIGAYAHKRFASMFQGDVFKIGVVLHPSPASPAANRGWSEAATKQLKQLGVF